MEALFYLVPALMIAGAVCAIVASLRRTRQIRRAWDGGLTAEGRCLRSYTTTSGGGETSVRTTLHHVYEFTTREGRTVRFDERNGPATTIEGDFVTVHYTAGHPERATALAPARGRLTAESGCLLAFFGVFIAFCLVFMVVVHTMFSVAGDFLP